MFKSHNIPQGASLGNSFLYFADYTTFVLPFPLPLSLSQSVLLSKSVDKYASPQRLLNKMFLLELLARISKRVWNTERCGLPRLPQRVLANDQTQESSILRPKPSTSCLSVCRPVYSHCFIPTPHSEVNTIICECGGDESIPWYIKGIASNTNIDFFFFFFCKGILSVKCCLNKILKKLWLISKQWKCFIS